MLLGLGNAPHLDGTNVKDANTGKRKEIDLEQQQNTRIIGLRVRNVKRLSAVDFEPDPGENVIGVGGKNAAGKTSLLDAIQYALAGTKSIPAGVVREGAQKGEIVIELDDFVVKRVIGKGAKLEITSRDKKKIASPQTLLDEMVGKLTFDPLRFQRLCETPAGRREQAELLRQLVGLDFTESDQKRAGIFGERTDVNRELKRVTGNLESMPHFAGVPKAAVSVADLSEQLGEAVQHNHKVEVDRLELQACEEFVQKTEAEIERAKQQLTELEADLAKRRALKLQAQAKVEDFKPVDESGLREQLANAETTNDKIRKNAARDVLLGEQDKLQKSYDSLTAEIGEIDEQKKSQLAGATMPIDNLTFTEDAVLYQDVPFENCSSAEQLRVSVAMGVALNPKLRIMLIRDGSLLDKDSRKMLREMAEAADLQCWVEMVNLDKECSIVIEDGMMLDEETAEKRRAESRSPLENLLHQKLSSVKDEMIQEKGETP